MHEVVDPAVTSAPEPGGSARGHRGPQRLGVLGVMGLLLLAPGAARAQAPTGSYESRVVQWGMAQHGLEPELQPDGKTVEEVLVAVQEIVSEDDPYPSWANLPHIRTRDSVVEREVLLQPGEPYSESLADETERNLLALGLFTVARVVPTKGSAPDRVRVLVVTKDLWSLRFATSYNLVGSLLQYLQFRPTETNFLGRGKRLSLELQLTLATYSLAQSYTDPRVLGSDLQLGESMRVFFNRETHEAEGTAGALVFGKPLRTLNTRWGFSTSADWTIQRYRQFRGAVIDTVTAPDGVTPIPIVFDVRHFSVGAYYTRSYGRELKTNWTTGVDAYNREYRIPASSQLSDENRAYFARTRLPHSENARYLATRVRSYRAAYRELQNVSTFALTERIQVGHSLVGRLQWAPGVLGSVSFVQGLASARYRWVWGDSVTSFTSTASARYWTREEDVAIEGSRWVNRRWAAELVEVSPRVGPGRFVARGIIDIQAFDLSESPLYLGGGNGLRGIAPDALVGNRRVMVNLEYRTRPLEFRTVHLGGVLFYDAGSAFDEAPDWAHTVGLGLRFLLPQFDVEPLRIDFGYAIRGPAALGIDRLSSAWGQVTEYGTSYVGEPHD